MGRMNGLNLILIQSIRERVWSLEVEDTTVTLASRDSWLR